MVPERKCVILRVVLLFLFFRNERGEREGGNEGVGRKKKEEEETKEDV